MEFAESYLIDPASFPDCFANSAWGERTTAIDFAGGPYLFTGLAQAQEQAIRNRFSGLCQTSTSDHPSEAVTARVFQGRSDLFRNIIFGDRDYTFDRQFTAEEVRLAGSSFMARIFWQVKIRGDIWTSASGGDDFTIIFENFFRVLAAYRLLRLGGMIFHSGCVVHQGKAYLLLGRSGAGKSTFSGQALAAGWEVLSDDLNAVRHQDGTWLVEKLPFAGDLGQTPGRSRSYPLAGIYVLRKGARNAITPLNRGRAVAKGLACSPVVNDDPFRTALLLDGLDAMVHQVPAAELEFSKEGGGLELLLDRGAMK